MNTFIVREYVEFPEGKVLLPLKTLVERLSFLDTQFWSLRQVTLRGGSEFFGIAMADFETLSKRLLGGIGLTDSDFRAFLQTDFQFLDGYIDCYGPEARMPLIRVECDDATVWEVSTEHIEIASQLDRLGFVRQ